MSTSTSEPDEAAVDTGRPAWRERAVSRSVDAARSRAEEKIQRFVDAGFALIDENGTTDFTIQEVIDRSQLSLRAFYRYFASKDELLLALFEETVREAGDDLRHVVETRTTALERLHAFTIRLHEWCDPSEKPRKRGAHDRRPIMEFSIQLAVDHPDRVKTAMAPIGHMARALVEQAKREREIDVDDTRQAAALIQQTVMYSWLGNRLADKDRARLTAEATWQFCLHGIKG